MTPRLVSAMTSREHDRDDGLPYVSAVTEELTSGCLGQILDRTADAQELEALTSRNRIRCSL